MATGITKTFELTGSKGGIKVEVEVTETYDAVQNTSDVSVGLRVKSSSYYNYTYYLSGSVKVDGATLVKMNSTVPTHYAQIAALNSYTTVRRWSEAYKSSPWTLSGIGHETDGSRAVTLEISLKGYTSGGGGGSGWSVATSRTIQLTHIPRESLIGATDANIGAVSMIAVTRRSAEYSHSIGYSFGYLSGYLTERGTVCQEEEKFTASGIAFTVPEDFYTQIPDSPTGKCTLTCRTYQGDTPIGEPQTTAFTVTAGREQCTPVVSGSVVDENPATLALTGDENVLVRYASNAVCTINAAARNCAVITKKSIGGVEVQGNSRTISGIEQGQVVFACTDSRGYTSSVLVEKTMIPYIPLTANVTTRRTDPTSGSALVTVSGNYYNGSFGAAENTLTVLCRVNGGEAFLLTAELKDGGYDAQAQLTGLDYQKSHTIQITVVDKLRTVERVITVGKGIPVFDWGEEDFAFHVPVTAPEINGCSNLALAAYPVGSVYISVSDANPGVLFGGTWERIEDCFLLAGGETFTPGTTGECAVETGTQGGSDQNNMPPYLAVYVWQRVEDPGVETAVLGVGVLGRMILGKEK